MRGKISNNKMNRAFDKKAPSVNTRKSTGSPLRNCLEKVPKLDL